MEIKQTVNKFYVGEESQPSAEITFVPAGDQRFIIDHTFVSDDLRGQGMGLQLVERVVQHAREQGKMIVPLCPFAKKTIDQHQHLQDVLVK
ncbi:GNAT family N-acetyltransferase [Jeotgalibacillus sp. R-1-5s-1]|uniref:GNAT family N-acetyltransferase n=1 Tax=Jeotgalibacillus sp. R-1-5s-1 TaxID=2555897 RepID=UPI001069C288|nr:GNAT family N-acetyltransferase [Jeotgalibacillus sp. R-1-5s-1]TFE00877.1 N-acetyltransferase [Jeotgalibacillus sp. R-1-5s-1]